MIPNAQRMVTELLARQLGIDVGELDPGVGDDPSSSMNRGIRSRTSQRRIAASRKATGTQASSIHSRV